MLWHALALLSKLTAMATAGILRARRKAEEQDALFSWSSRHAADARSIHWLLSVGGTWLVSSLVILSLAYSETCFRFYAHLYQWDNEWLRFAGNINSFGMLLTGALLVVLLSPSVGRFATAGKVRLLYRATLPIAVVSAVISCVASNLEDKRGAAYAQSQALAFTMATPDSAKFWKAGTYRGGGEGTVLVPVQDPKYDALLIHFSRPVGAVFVGLRQGKTRAYFNEVARPPGGYSINSRTAFPKRGVKRGIPDYIKRLSPPLSRTEAEDLRDLRQLVLQHQEEWSSRLCDLSVPLQYFGYFANELSNAAPRTTVPVQ